MSLFSFKKKNYDELEFAELYRKHITMIRHRARYLLKNEQAAEDIAQETFLKFLNYQQKGGTAQETAAFLYRTATNLALNRIRDSKRRRELLAQNTPEKRTHERDPTDRMALERVLCQASAEEAQIAVHYYIDGMTQHEIAELLGIQRRTIGRRLERFNQLSRSILETEKGSSP